MEVSLRCAAPQRTRPARDTRATPHLHTRARDTRPCTMHRPTKTSRTARPCTAQTHHATTHSSTKHTACCTRPRLYIRPVRPSRTSCAVAACAKSHVSVGAKRPQHPQTTGNGASRPFKGPQHLLCPHSCHLLVTGDQQASPASPPEHAARPGTRQSERTRRKDGDSCRAGLAARLGSCLSREPRAVHAPYRFPCWCESSKRMYVCHSSLSERVSASSEELPHGSFHWHFDSNLTKYSYIQKIRTL